MTTPTPHRMPPRRRVGRVQLDAGGPLMPGHRHCLADIAAGLIAHVPHDDGRWHWEWADWPGAREPVRIPRPRRWYLDELLRAGWIAVDGGDVVIVIEQEGAA